jgi:hypothetical protein
MTVSCSNGFTPWDVIWWRHLLVIEKTGSQVFFLFNSTNLALYCKNDLVSSQNAFSTEDLIFLWFLVNAAKKFHIFL